MSPFVYRPRNALLMSTGMSLVLILASLMGWYALPADIRALFTAFQLGTLAFFVLFMVGFMMALGLSVLRVDGDGLTIRNALRTHRVPWGQVRGFRMVPGESFAQVLITEEPGRRLLLAVQRVDGPRAQAVIDRLRNWQQQAS